MASWSSCIFPPSQIISNTHGYWVFGNLETSLCFPGGGGLFTKSCSTLCNPMNCSPPGSFVHGISQQEYWCELPCPPLGDHLNPGIEPAAPGSLALQADSSLLSYQGRPPLCFPASARLPGTSSVFFSWVEMEKLLASFRFCYQWSHMHIEGLVHRDQVIWSTLM